MIKILHGADFHLDSAFSSLPPEQAALRRREQRLALEQLALLCEDCDLLFLAGDLFDSARIFRDTLDALRGFFATVKAQVFISPGNHDYPAAGSPYLTEDWGENVHIFKTGAIECVHLEEPRCNVYGAAFTGPEMPALLKNFRAQGDCPNFMVLHGELQANSVYNPITGEEIAASGLDYLALGHVHQTSVQRFGKTLCAMPGCLMGRGFDECGQKGVLKVTMDKKGCEAAFVPVVTRKYEILTVPAGENPLEAIRAALPENTMRDCYRILLTGEADGIDVDALEAVLAPDFFSLSVRDRTVPKRALWEKAGEDTLRGHFLQNLKEQYETADAVGRQTIAAAARLVTALMDGREVPL